MRTLTNKSSGRFLGFCHKNSYSAQILAAIFNTSDWVEICSTLSLSFSRLEKKEFTLDSKSFFDSASSEREDEVVLTFLDEDLFGLGSIFSSKIRLTGSWMIFSSE